MMHEKKSVRRKMRKKKLRVSKTLGEIANVFSAEPGKCFSLSKFLPRRPFQFLVDKAFLKLIIKQTITLKFLKFLL